MLLLLLPLQVLGDSSVQCPELDLTGGFKKYFDNALKKTSNPPFDPFKNDVNFLLATWSLEEIGATGDKVHSCMCCDGMLRHVM